MDRSVKIVRDQAILTTSYVYTDPFQCAKHNQLNYLIRAVKGSVTTIEYLAQFAAEVLYDLAYDGQSANFTAGLIVTGGLSGATGLIVSDTDGGATGTLVIRPIKGTFADNEALTDSSTGVAVVNGVVSVSDFNWVDDTVETFSTGVSTPSANVYQKNASFNFVKEIPLCTIFSRIGIKYTGGTATGSSAYIESIYGGE